MAKKANNMKRSPSGDSDDKVNSKWRKGHGSSNVWNFKTMLGGGGVIGGVMIFLGKVAAIFGPNGLPFVNGPPSVTEQGGGHNCTAYNECPLKVFDDLKTFFVPPPPPTIQQDLVAYANRVTAISMDQGLVHDDNETIKDMQKTGMKEMRAVTAFSAPKSVIEERIRSQLDAKNIPDAVITSITSQVSSVSKCIEAIEDFKVDDTGTGFIFKVIVMIKPEPADAESSQVAMAVSGAEFDVAKVVETYREQEEPIWREEEEVQMVKKSGWLGDYEEPVTVKKQKYIGQRKTQVPVFKKRTYTDSQIENIKKYLERKTLGDVNQLLFTPRDGP